MRRKTTPKILIPTLCLALAPWLSSAAAQDTPTARYRVTFEAVWTAATHPGDHPSGAHFSPVIGTAHSGEVDFWEPGTEASPGIERMAEQGRSTPFDEEVAAAVAAGQAAGFVSAPGISSPGQVSLELTVSDDHPLVTLVTMVAPSPDWFLGVDGISMRRGGRWVRERRVELLAWDAGTDSGSTFEAPNDDTQPRETVHLITDGTLGNGVPMGTFTFERLDGTPPAPLALGGGRFEVEVEWETLDGAKGFGTGQPLTGDTGTFWFFRDSNTELVVKVLDACDGPGRFWVFAGGLTNVGVEIRVTDTLAGETRTYRSPVGTPFEPLQDTRGFATCP